MSFREKSTWVTFVLLFIAFGVYFGNAFSVLHAGHRSPGTPNLFSLFVMLVVGVIALEVVVHILLAVRTPKDAKTPKDEREKLIHLKSMRPAFYILLIGGLLVIGTMHLGTTVYLMAHSVLLVLWVAELVRYGTQLYYFRRGV